MARPLVFVCMLMLVLMSAALADDHPREQNTSPSHSGHPMHTSNPSHGAMPNPDYSHAYPAMEAGSSTHGAKPLAELPKSRNLTRTAEKPDNPTDAGNS